MPNKLTILRAYWAARQARKPVRRPTAAPLECEATVYANFERYNALGISLEEARRLAREELETGRNPYPGYSFGLSSGTTGEPGVFLTNEHERDVWLGTVLGKFLSPGQVLSLNAALLLKHNNRLYQASNRVHYFDISTPSSLWAPRLCDLAPSVLIGPPGVLQALAETAAFQRRPLRPHTLLAGGEVLYPQDRERLARAYGVAPRGLYQAKEGFLAAGCAAGGLHWNEDLVEVEWMRFYHRPDRAVPVITDFARQSQTFRRYRLDDVVKLSGACGCATPFQRVGAVEGRLQDILLLPAPKGGFRPLFPFEVNAVLKGFADYRLYQHDAYHFTLAVPGAPGREVLAALTELLERPSRLEIVPLRAEAPEKKRRRVQRLFDEGNSVVLESLVGPPGGL
jgi:putative adenylate-forming enzyme